MTHTPDSIGEKMRLFGTAIHVTGSDSELPRGAPAPSRQLVDVARIRRSQDFIWSQTMFSRAGEPELNCRS